MSTPKTPTVPDPSALPASGLIGGGQEGGLADQARAYISRVRGGDMGVLPAVGGLVVLSILFTALSQYFLTERNIANLLTQAAPSILLAMGLVFVILLGEIDLPAGTTSGVTMALFVVLSHTDGINLPWIVALHVALASGVL